MTQTPNITQEDVAEISFAEDWRERAQSYKGALKRQKAWVDGFTCARDQAHTLADRLAEVEAALDKAEQRYQRDCLGLNNEGDPIGGNPPSGWKPRAETAEARIEELEAALTKAANRLDWCCGLLESDIARDKATEWGEEARTTIAELKGEKDE
jgi:HPt (histidine-containing phosphotransfer) domain-containing protein